MLAENQPSRALVCIWMQLINEIMQVVGRGVNTFVTMREDLSKTGNLVWQREKRKSPNLRSIINGWSLPFLSLKLMLETFISMRKWWKELFVWWTAKTLQCLNWQLKCPKMLWRTLKWKCPMTICNCATTRYIFHRLNPGETKMWKYTS